MRGGSAERALLAAVLLALVGAVFGPVRGHDFVDLDDRKYILQNPDVRAGLGREGLARVFLRPYHGDWIPLTYLSLQASYSLHGERAAGYLLTNVALHAASTLLLFLALGRMSGAYRPSAFAAAVFAVHPLHVESVAWAFERKDCLSGLFWMLALLAYAGYAARPSPGRYAAVLLSLLLGLLAKPMLVTLPLVLLLLDYWPLGRLSAGGRAVDPGRLRRAALEKLPLLALAAAAAAATLWLHRAATGGATTVPLEQRLAAVPVTWVSYLAKALWPSDLGVLYAFPAGGYGALPVLASLLLLALLTAVCLRLGRSRPYLAVGWLWYAVTLLPVSGLVQLGEHLRADRYSYLPLVGISLALAWGAAEALGGSRRGRVLLALAGGAAVAALAVAAHRQVGHWRDSESLFRRAAAVSPESPRAHRRLAAALVEQGRLEEAERPYRETIRLAPGWPEPRLELASLLERQGRLLEAVAFYETGLALDPDHAVAHGRLGQTLVLLGRFEEALGHLERAVASLPDSPRNHAALAMAAERTGRLEQALRHNREALRLVPGFASVANNLAWILATAADPALRDPEEALRLARELRARRSNDPNGLDTLAAAQAAAGRFDAALATARRAERLARQRGQAELAGQIRRRAESYAEGRPHVEPLRAPAPR